MNEYMVSILAHPDTESFCAALWGEYNRAVQEHLNAPGGLIHRNLYQEEYNPVLQLPELRRHIPIEELAMSYIHDLQKARSLALFFPDWWGAEPAILKGWIDRSLRPHIGYARNERSGPGGQANRESSGLLGNLQLRLFITSDTANDGRQSLLNLYEHRYRDIIGAYCGISKIAIRLFTPLRSSRFSQRKAWLQEAVEDGRNDSRA